MATETGVRIPRNPFLDAVRKSGLLTPDDLVGVLARYQPDEIAAADPIKLATLLVGKKLLTKFQAMQLLNGKTQGFHLGRYKILEGIRQDRVGMVFLAEHSDHKHKASLKVLPAERVADPTVFNAFRAEVKDAAKADHANVARILEMANSAGTWFVASEHVPAPTLDKTLAKSGPLDPHLAAQLVARVAVGLMHCHGKGLLHRDIKPGNIAVLPGGHVKLLDLGLTHMLENPWQKVTKRINMKEYADEIAHIAPEQAWGCELDARSDVYSLGSTFYTLLTGEPPFPGLAMQTMTERQVRDIPAPSEVRQGVPRELDELVQKMGAKDPNSRFRTAAEVVQALHPWLPVAEWAELKVEFGAALAPPPKPAPPKDARKGFFGRLLAKLRGR